MDNSKLFAAKGEYDLNQSSAGVIPINSMYDGEEDRTAAIPPPLDGTEEKIDEAPEETAHVSDHKEEQAPATMETETKKNTVVAEESQKSATNIGKAESMTKVTASQASLASSKKMIPVANRPGSKASVPEENKPVEGYEPTADHTNFEGEEAAQ